MAKVSQIVQRGLDRGVPVLPEDSARVGLGTLFTAAVGVDLVDDATLSFLIIPDPTVRTFIRAAGITSERSQVRTIEGSTFTNNGTLLTPRDRNRRLKGTPGLTVYQDPVIDVEGDVIRDIRVVGGNGGGFTISSGGAGLAPLDWELDNNDNYVIEIKNISGTFASVTLGIEFAEEPF